MLLPVLLLLGCQAKMIYYPQAYNDSYRQSLSQHRGIALPYSTQSGRQTAHYIPPRSGRSEPRAIWLCYSGNGALALDWLNFVNDWDPDFAYLMVDYPGYGDCAGAPSPAKIQESSLAAAKALAVHLKVEPESLQPRLGVIAHSIGCAAGLMAADTLNIQKVVLVAPFTTLTDMGKRILGWPLCYVNMHRFNNRTHLAKVVEQGAKVVIYHGTEDEVVPIAMGRELAAAHPDQVVLHEKDGGDHNMILWSISKEMGRTMSEL